MNQSSWISPKAEIRESTIQGKGMFARKTIQINEKVVVWKGRYINKKEAKKLEGTGKLIMQWDDDLFSIEERGDDDGYFINHSCDGNLWMKDAYTLVARKEIPKGNELTVDYALWEAGSYISNWQCHCGSSLCRHTITGNDWKLKEVQQRYKNHFSPLVNKLIAYP